MAFLNASSKYTVNNQKAPPSIKVEQISEQEKRKCTFEFSFNLRSNWLPNVNKFLFFECEGHPMIADGVTNDFLYPLDCKALIPNVILTKSFKSKSRYPCNFRLASVNRFAFRRIHCLQKFSMHLLFWSDNVPSQSNRELQIDNFKLKSIRLSWPTRVSINLVN